MDSILEENERVIGILQSNITSLRKEINQIADCSPLTAGENEKMCKLSSMVQSFENTIQFLKEREAKYREECGFERVG